MHINRYGEFSRKNPVRRREAIRRVKREYETTVRGKWVRLCNYVMKSNFILNCKSQIGCQRCELITDPEELLFHHSNPIEKKFNVGAGNATRSWNAILKEIEKCKIVCWNCHIAEHEGSFRVSQKIINETYQKKDINSECQFTLF